ncbi:MAG: hypothetical protein ABI091_18255 [Ferruginibacter sp.]
MIFKISWVILIAGTLCMMFIMAITGRSMKHPATPFGIVNLELASNATDVQNILNAWDNDISQHRDVLADARKNTWLDFIFIIFYSLLFYCLCKKISGYFKKNLLLQKSGKVFAMAALAAGTLDYGENIGMLTSLNGHITNGVSLFTATCSIIKWTLLLCILVFLVISFGYKYFVQDKKKAFL